jgi:sulfur-oxidizing protein SoxY
VIGKLKELSGSTSNATAETESTASRTLNIVLPAVPAAPRVSGKTNDADSQTWAAVVDGNTIEDYKLYLESYPQGKYAKQANEQKQKLEAYSKATAEAATAQAEDNAWGEAQQGDSESSYNIYLKQFPAGRYVALAKIKSKKSQQVTQVAEETTLWNKASTNNNQAFVQAYLSRFPTGRYVADANAKLKFIKEEEAKSNVIPLHSNVLPFDGEQMLRALRSGNVVTDSTIIIRAPEIAENGAVVPVEISVARSFDKGERLFIVVNDSYVGASLTPYDLGTKIYLSTRVKMPASGQLKAVLLDASGNVRIAAKYISVTVGAGIDIRGKEESCGEVKMRVARSGDEMEVKALLNCMQSNEQYIKTINVLVGGGKVAEIGLTPGSSKNPFVGLKCRSGGNVEFQIDRSDGGRRTGTVLVN